MSRILRTLFLVIAVGSASLAAKAEEGPTPEDVAFVQGMLVRFGYDPGPIDGICGDLTTAAVRAFHADRSLPLKPGKIEPQAATVVKNLTTHLTQDVLEPTVQPLEVYEKALAGDADAAHEVGLMYWNGDAVPADKMMAYAWWSVAETYGSSDAATLRASLKSTGVITPHELTFAGSLAKQICASADLKKGKKLDPAEAASGQSGPQTTM